MLQNSYKHQLDQSSLQRLSLLDGYSHNLDRRAHRHGIRPVERRNRSGGGCPNDSCEELQGPADLVRATTSNGLDVFPSLCATDGDKQFIDNQSVDGGRLLLVPPVTHKEPDVEASDAEGPGGGLTHT